MPFRGVPDELVVGSRSVCDACTRSSALRSPRELEEPDLVALASRSRQQGMKSVSW
jgi:hypothetical protein